MPRWPRALVALLLTLVPATVHAGTLIDSYTHALPPNYWLEVTHPPILFLGSFCDGDACPPSTMVTFPDDQAFEIQSDVTGAISPWRGTGLVRHHLSGPPDQGVLRIDPTNGGSMVIEGASGAGLIVSQLWGDLAHPLNLELTADGSDRFEIDILEAANEPSAVHVEVDLYSSSAPFGVSREWIADGPGTISIPYASIANLATVGHDIDVIQLVLYIPSGTPPPLVVGEFRTAATPSPAVPQTWGRIKGAYRR